MKLGIVALEFPPKIGGMEQHALGLANTLAAHYEVKVYTDAAHFNHKYVLPYQVYPMLRRNRADLWQLSRENVDVFLVLNAGYSILSRFTRKDVFCYCHGNDYLNPWIYSAHPSLYVGLDLLAKTPYFWRFEKGVRRRLNRLQVAAGFKKISGLFTNSEYTAKRVVKEYPDIKCCVDVSYPGVPDHFFVDDNASREPELCWRFLTVARLSRVARKKNVDNVLRAMASIQSTVNFEYIVIGDGELRPGLEDLSARLGLSEKVTFLGALDSQGVKRWFDSSDLFILPSKSSATDVESFGIVYAEAAARGVPCLASREGGAVDAVSDGLSGIIIDHSDPGSIAEGILRFTNSNNQYNPANIRQWAQRFRWCRTTKVIRARLGE